MHYKCLGGICSPCFIDDEFATICQMLKSQKESLKNKTQTNANK